MEVFKKGCQSVSCTLAEIGEAESVNQITVLAIIALVIAGSLLSSFLKLTAVPTRHLSIFCLKKILQVTIDKIFETFLLSALLALAGVPPFAAAARLLLSLLNR
jgi:hypothetical protein